MDPRIALLFLMAIQVFAAQVTGFVAMMQVVRRRRLETIHSCLKQRRQQRIRRRMCLMLTIFKAKPERRLTRRRITSSYWWDSVVPQFSDKEWIENFRVRRGTFNWICNEVREALAPSPNPVIVGQAVTVEKIVAIAIYKLSHLAEYLVIGNLFGVSKTTVHRCVYAFCYAITELAAEIIKFPNAEEAEEIALHFEETTCLPQLIGAIDGSHIPITAPRKGSADFYNRSGYHSIVLQAVVDHQYLFRNISCNMPGACHDADVLRQSTFFKDREILMPKGCRHTDGVDIPYMIMGDPAYPLQDWLLKNYTYDKNTTPHMDSFNVYMNKGRVVVENAFGRLKSRWRILARQSDIDYRFMPKVVAACCILHNICELSKEKVSNRWLLNLQLDEELYPQPPTLTNDSDNQYAAEDVRDHLMLYLSRRCATLTSSRGRCVAVC